MWSAAELALHDGQNRSRHVSRLSKYVSQLSQLVRFFAESRAGHCSLPSLVRSTMLVQVKGYPGCLGFAGCQEVR